MMRLIVTKIDRTQIASQATVPYAELYIFEELPAGRVERRTVATADSQEELDRLRKAFPPDGMEGGGLGVHFFKRADVEQVVAQEEISLLKAA